VRIVSFISRRSSITRVDDCEMDMMDVDACSRSRYRSLRFRHTFSTYHRRRKGRDAPNHQSKLLLLCVSFSAD